MRKIVCCPISDGTDFKNHSQKDFEAWGTDLVNMELQALSLVRLKALEDGVERQTLYEALIPPFKGYF